MIWHLNNNEIGSRGWLHIIVDGVICFCAIPGLPLLTPKHFVDYIFGCLISLYHEVFKLPLLFLALSICLSSEKDIPQQEGSAEPAERRKYFWHSRWGKPPRGGSRWRRRGGGQRKEACQVNCLLFAIFFLRIRKPYGSWSFLTVEKSGWHVKNDMTQTVRKKKIVSNCTI